MLNITPANNTDLKWMFKSFIHAANKGHFVMQNTGAGRETIKRNIQSIVLNQEIVDSGLRAEAMIFENQLGKTGYVVIADTRPGVEGKEIYIFVIDDEHRGNGYGRYMLDEVIRRWSPVCDFYARCLPASRVMAGMLKKAGFLCQGINSDGAEIYRLACSSGQTAKSEFCFPHSFQDQMQSTV